MKVKNLLYAFGICIGPLYCNSITENMGDYKDVCLLASQDPATFQEFRQSEPYKRVAEIVGYEQKYGAHVLGSCSPSTLQYLPVFAEWDRIGNPHQNHFVGAGQFSAATLRYIFVGDLMKKLFFLENGVSIVEIGGRGAMQALVLSLLVPVKDHLIIDTKEPCLLVEKIAEHTNTPMIYTTTPDQLPTNPNIDLFISNYGFSEYTKDTQDEFIEKILRHAKRGFLLYNHLSSHFDLESYNSEEFIQKMAERGIECKRLYDLEPLFAEQNHIVYWDTTR